MIQRRANRAALLVATGIAVTFSAPALAQVDDPNDPTLEESPVQTQSGGLETIVVTAERRTQNLQETPLAITAITSEEVELLGIQEAKDLSAIAPNVAVVGGTTNATAAVISIRGIPTPGDETFGFDSPIGVYLDGVYLARAAAATFEVADIERVEVLRGPQGTLFGRNTTGGAINFITARPTADRNLSFRVGVGNYDSRIFRAVANIGDVGDGLFRATFAALHKERDGVVDNLLEPKDSRDPGAQNLDGVRAAIEIEPTDNLLITNIADYTRIDSVAFAQQTSRVGDGTFRPNVFLDGFEFSQVQPANLAGYFAQPQTRVLEPGCGRPLDSVVNERLDELCLDNALPVTDEVYGNLTRIELELGGVTIRSSTAFRAFDNLIRGSELDGLGTLEGPLFDQNTLFNGLPASLTQFIVGAPAAAFLETQAVPTVQQPIFAASNERHQDQFSQELEIIGDSGAFQWVLGGFYFKEDGTERNPQRFSFVLDTNQAVFSDATFGALGAGLRAANQANGTRFRALPIVSTLAYGVKAESKAVYGQGTYRFGGPDGALGVTLGLRYTWDTKEIDRTQNGAVPFSEAELPLNQKKAKFSEPTGNLTLDYRASDDVNFYARVARGYRSGGFNARQSTQLDNPATPDINEEISLIPFGEEKITSYEVGAKTEFFDRLRLNGALFYNKYTDQQATIPIPIVGGGSFGTQVVNAGSTEYKGFELEARLSVSDPLTLDGSVGYVDRDIQEFPGADITGEIRNVASIIVNTYAPAWTANAGATYATFLGAGETRLTARIGANYTSAIPQFNNTLTAPFQDVTGADERVLLNAQLRLDAIPFGGQDLSLTLWGKNLLDEEYKVRGVDFGALGQGASIYGEPLTYGLTAELTF